MTLAPLFLALLALLGGGAPAHHPAHHSPPPVTTSTHPATPGHHAAWCWKRAADGGAAWLKAHPGAHLSPHLCPPAGRRR